MTILVTALAVWAICGVIIATLLARHGHNFWLFVLMGLGYGPFLVLVWLRGVRGQPVRSVIIKPGGGQANAGWIDVLVGLDGSEASVTSAHEVLKTLGAGLGRVQLASVLDHEISNQPDAFTADERRIAYLEQAAIELDVPHAEIVLLAGRPDKALLEHADRNNFDVLVIAHRANDLVNTLQGSTASRLARRADLPVMIGPPA